MKSLLKLLFVDSQNSKNTVDEDVADLFEDAEDMERLEIDAKPLHTALKEIGVDRALVSSPGGLRMEFDDESEYDVVRHKLLDINSVHPLASAGWVATSSDNVEPTDELPKYVINFIELKVADTGKGADSAEELETLIKNAQKLGGAEKADNEPGGGVTRESVAHIDQESDALVERLLRGEPFHLDEQDAFDDAQEEEVITGDERPEDAAFEEHPEKFSQGPGASQHSNYGWIITSDFVADDTERHHEHVGPRNVSPDFVRRLKEGQGQRFRMYDDDGVKMYEGRYIGPDDETMFAPKDDFGEPDGGATRIWYDGIGEL